MMAPPAPTPPTEFWADPCSVCGAEVTGWSEDVETEDYYYAASLYTVVVARHFTVQPCGHVVPTIRIYTRGQ